MKDIDPPGHRIDRRAGDQPRRQRHRWRHVSFDIDACDPLIAPGVGTPVKGGLNYREAHMVMEIVADSGLLTSMDLVEVNPTLDVRNATAQLGSELALSALGMKIL
jgi:arginase